MSAYIRSEREELEEKLDLLYEERERTIDNEELFKAICSKIAAIELKFFTWDNRDRWNRQSRLVPRLSMEMITIN